MRREGVRKGGGKGERREKRGKEEGREREGRDEAKCKFMHTLYMHVHELYMYCTFSGECGGTACHSVKNSSLFFKVHPLRKGGREREGGEKERDKEREGQMKDTFQPPPHTHTHHTPPPSQVPSGRDVGPQSPLRTSHSQIFVQRTVDHSPPPTGVRRILSIIINKHPFTLHTLVSSYILPETSATCVY